MLFSQAWPGLTQTNIEYHQTSLITSAPRCQSGTTVSMCLSPQIKLSLSSMEPLASSFEMLIFPRKLLSLERKMKALKLPVLAYLFLCTINVLEQVIADVLWMQL